MFKKILVCGIFLFTILSSTARTIDYSPLRLKWSNNLSDNNVMGYYIYWRRNYENFNDNRRFFVKKTNNQEMEFDLRSLFVYLANGGYFFAVSAVDSSKNEGRLSLEAYYLLCSHVRESLPIE